MRNIFGFFIATMSRHRDVRNLDYDEEYDDAYDDDVYGHSVEEYEYGLSPTMEEYMYSSRSRETNLGFGAYLPTDSDIVEEEETDTTDSRNRHDSDTYEKPKLSDEDEVRLSSVMDELRNILGGDQFSDCEMTQMVLANKFDLNDSLNALLNKQPDGETTTTPPATTTAAVLPQRQQRQNRGNKGPSTAKVEKLTISGPASSSGVSTSGGAASSTITPVKANVPVVVSSSSAAQDTGMPKVTRGFAVLQTEDCSSNTPSNHLNAVNQDSKRSRSNTPIRNKDKENKEVKDKDKENENKENKDAREREKESPPESKVTTKIRDKEVDVVSEFTSQRKSGKELLNLVVVGHVDAGKSTLMGHLLYLKGNVHQRTMHKYEQESKKIGKQSFAFAWVLDETDEERSRGVTVDIAQRVFESESKNFTLLDAPGHKDFIPNMITGAARADVAVLVVDATTGAFEAGFESGGQTREHAILIRSLGVSQLVVAVNKLDTVEWRKERFTQINTTLRQFLKTVGFKDSDVTYIPCSGLTGQNLVEAPNDSALLSWYKGTTLLQAIDKLKVPDRGVSRPVRMCISDVFKGQGSNMCVSGRLETGYVQNGDRLMLLPHGDIVTVKGVTADNAAPGSSFAGDHCTLTIAGITDTNDIHIGDFLCDPMKTIPQVTRIQGRVVVFNIQVPLIKGAMVDFHYQCCTEPAKIRKLVSQLHKTTGEVLKNKPRALVKNSAAVIEVEFSRPVSLELFRDSKELGRFMLRSGGSTIAAGLVTMLLG